MGTGDDINQIMYGAKRVPFNHRYAELGVEKSYLEKDPCQHGNFVC